MKSFTLSAIILVVVSAQVLGKAVKREVDLAEITFVKQNKKLREQVTVVDKEAKFEVLGTNAKLVLDYQNDKIVFTNPNKEGVCYINNFDTELKEMISLDKIKESLLANSQMDFPNAKYRMPETNYEEQGQLPKLGRLSTQLCEGSTILVGNKPDSTQAAAKTTKKPMKAEVGFWEVVLIIVIIIFI